MPRDSQKWLRKMMQPRQSFKNKIFSSGLYQRSLKNRTPKKFLFTPADCIQGVKERADSLFQGDFQLLGVSCQIPGEKPWSVKNMPAFWQEELHRFNWLRDFSINGSDAGRRHARALVLSWIKEFETFQSLAWDPHLLARRLINWMQQSEFLLTKSDGDFNYKFIQSIRLQHQHLRRYCRYFANEPDRLDFYIALYLGAACFTDTQIEAVPYEEQLFTELDKVLLPDGTHISKNPSHQFSILADLISLRETYTNREIRPPMQLTAGIERLVTSACFFLHRDGEFAQFNGGYTLNQAAIESLLIKSNVVPKIPAYLPDGGFVRLKSGQSTLIMDTGSEELLQKTHHHGLGSFEFSHENCRLIVNCGSHPDDTSPWQQALAKTAAHSAISIADVNAQIWPHVPKSGENTDHLALNEADGNLWLDFNNPGYEDSLNVSHSRRIFLSADGHTLKGEDCIQARGTMEEATDFCLRFHLHTQLEVSKSVDGRNLLLQTASGSDWIFLSSHPEITLEASINCPAPSDTKNGHQILLKGRLISDEPTIVKWALHKNREETAD